jgi:hypothetical protein
MTVGFEVSTAVTRNMAIFWDKVPCDEQKFTDVQELIAQVLTFQK